MQLTIQVGNLSVTIQAAQYDQYSSFWRIVAANGIEGRGETFDAAMENLSLMLSAKFSEPPLTFKP